MIVKVMFSIHPGLLKEFDSFVEEAHYSSRSAAITTAMRDLIQKHVVARGTDPDLS